jgi:uncharacterized membrane protein
VTPKSRLPSAVFVFLVFAGFLQARKFAATMPPVLATHFGGSGAPNGWQTQSQSQFFVLEIVMLGVCLLLAFGIPRLIGALPISLVNVPNKEYWLAPERREETLAFFRAQFAWFGCGFLAFLIVVNQLVFDANQTQPRRLNGGAFAVALVAFLAYVGIWTVRMIVRFAKVPK